MGVLIESILSYLPLVILIWLPIALYYYGLYINLYWKRNNIPYIPASPFVGNLLPMFSFQKCVADILDSFYNDRRAIGKPFVGIHYFHKPALLIRSPEMVKQVLVKDFSSFSDRYTATLHKRLTFSSFKTGFRIEWIIFPQALSIRCPFGHYGKHQSIFHSESSMEKHTWKIVSILYQRQNEANVSVDERYRKWVG